ncbi:MAG: hypothetical protein V7672_06455 [Brevundimonas sp.]|jgi:hypothetical protein|uniref:hypothetical protein n=1 Tax=Brevundimonas sp. TaxID=1871086 RepID=UPI003002DB73
MSDEYVFRIDAYQPETIPMERLAKYMLALADLVGSKASTHFVRLEKGSTKLVHAVDPPEAPKVAQRLRQAVLPSPPPDVAKAVSVLDDMLAGDNAVGELIHEGAVIIPFPGRTRPPVLTFPTFKQAGSIDGEIVSLGGKDKTAHVILQDGPITYSNISVTRDQARELAGNLYRGKVRLYGDGRWERLPDGGWKLIGFSVDRFEALDDAPLDMVLAELREVLPEDTQEGTHDRLMNLRLGDEGLH